MATSNIPITKTWTKIADDADDPWLVRWEGGAHVEFATTAADTAPTIKVGHVLKPGDTLTRLVFGGGYLWARCADNFANATMVVNK